MVWACPPPPLPPAPAPPACVVHTAHQYARMLHDRHPRWIHAVETTYDQAIAAISDEPPAEPGGGRVVVIEIKGKLLDDFDPTPPFAQGPRKGRYFVMVLDPVTCQESAHGIGPTGVRLRPLGQVTTIK
jgi:hypothetical protein